MTKNTQNKNNSGYRLNCFIHFPIHKELGEPISPYVRMYLDHKMDYENPKHNIGRHLVNTQFNSRCRLNIVDYNSNFIATHDRGEVIEWIKCKSELFSESKVFYLEYGDNEELIDCIFQAAMATRNHKYYIRLGSVIDVNKLWNKLRSGNLVQPDNLHIRKYLGKEAYQDISGFTELKYDLRARTDELDFFPEHGKEDPVLKLVPYTGKKEVEFGFLRPMNEQEMEFLNLF